MIKFQVYVNYDYNCGLLKHSCFSQPYHIPGKTPIKTIPPKIAALELLHSPFLKLALVIWSSFRKFHFDKVGMCAFWFLYDYFGTHATNMNIILKRTNLFHVSVYEIRYCIGK